MIGHNDTLYGLILNPMQGRLEERHCVATSTSPEKLEEYMQSLLVESYKESVPGWNDREYTYYKSFAKWSPLEWYNKPDGYAPYIQIVSPDITVWNEQRIEICAKYNFIG